jgi:hypothetical protein
MEEFYNRYSSASYFLIKTFLIITYSGNPNLIRWSILIHCFINYAANKYKKPCRSFVYEKDENRRKFWILPVNDNWKEGFLKLLLLNKQKSRHPRPPFMRYNRIKKSWKIRDLFCPWKVSEPAPCRLPGIHYRGREECRIRHVLNWPLLSADWIPIPFTGIGKRPPLLCVTWFCGGIIYLLETRVLVRRAENGRHIPGFRVSLPGGNSQLIFPWPPA